MADEKWGITPAFLPRLSPTAASHKADGAGPSHGRGTERLLAACREFESLFISQLLKAMRATVPKSGFLSGGATENMLTAMRDTHLSRQLSRSGGIGLAEMLRRKLISPETGPQPEPSLRSEAVENAAHKKPLPGAKVGRESADS
jgi:Rod binding domain-containing protein